MELMKPYFEKYYSTLPTIVGQRDRQFSETFMSMLSPSFLARQEDLDNFNAMLESPEAKEHDFFNEFLKKTIETITMVTAAKKFCAEYKAQ
jgi:hypothetical protein